MPHHLSVPRFWTCWIGLLAVELIILCQSASKSWLTGRDWVWASVPLAMLAISAATAAMRLRSSRTTETGAARVLARIWLPSMLALWLAFWVLDAREAEVQVLLFALPIAIVIDSFRGIGALTGPGSVTVFTWTILWHFFERRSDNGCTGVSDAYEWTLLLSMPLLFLLSPWAMANAHTRSNPHVSQP